MPVRSTRTTGGRRTSIFAPNRPSFRSNPNFNRQYVALADMFNRNRRRHINFITPIARAVGVNRQGRPLPRPRRPVNYANVAAFMRRRNQRVRSRAFGALRSAAASSRVRRTRSKWSMFKYPKK